jgi:GNAT superfamily N-acetyltransferase
MRAHMQIRRLECGDEDLARDTFAMMTSVFDEGVADLGSAYVVTLLARPDFWAMAALDGEEVVGGLTAHALPMTRSPEAELFIYDLAVRADRQRRGIGRALVLATLDQHGHVAKTALSDRSVARVVQRAAFAAGLDPSREAIMRQTGHKSERVARGYIQHATVFVNLTTPRRGWCDGRPSVGARHPAPERARSRPARGARRARAPGA